MQKLFILYLCSLDVHYTQTSQSTSVLSLYSCVLMFVFPAELVVCNSSHKGLVFTEPQKCPQNESTNSPHLTHIETADLISSIYTKRILLL